MNFTNILSNTFPSVNGYFLPQISGVFIGKISLVVVNQSSFCTIINTMLSRKPAPVAGFGVYNGLSTTATKTLKNIITLVTEFTENTKNSKSRGEVNILKFLSHKHSISFSFVRTNSDQNCTYTFISNQFNVRKGVGVSYN